MLMVCPRLYVNYACGEAGGHFIGSGALCVENIPDFGSVPRPAMAELLPWAEMLLYRDIQFLLTDHLSQTRNCDAFSSSVTTTSDTYYTPLQVRFPPPPRALCAWLETSVPPPSPSMTSLTSQPS